MHSGASRNGMGILPLKPKMQESDAFQGCINDHFHEKSVKQLNINFPVRIQQIQHQPIIYFYQNGNFLYIYLIFLGKHKQGHNRYLDQLRKSNILASMKTFKKYQGSFQICLDFLTSQPDSREAVCNGPQINADFFWQLFWPRFCKIFQ